MKCPKCYFEQPDSDACSNCGIIFSRYKEAQARKQKEDIRPARKLSNISHGNDLLFYSMGVLFLSVLFVRCVYFLKFPDFLDPYFRLLMLGALCWLTFSIVPRTAALFTRLDKENDFKPG